MEGEGQGGASWARLSEALPAIGSLVAIAAGASALVYVVGGAVMWVRLEQADLPALPALTVVPRETLLAIGLGQLLGPAVLASVTFVIMGAATRKILSMFTKRNRARMSTIHMNRVFVLSALVATSVAITLMILPFSWAQALTAITVIALAAYLLYLERRHFHTGRPYRIEFVLVATVVVSCLAVALQLEEPTWLEGVQVATADGTTRGHYVASTSNAVYVGARGTLIAVPAARVERVEISPPPSRPEHTPYLFRWLGFD